MLALENEKKQFITGQVKENLEKEAIEFFNREKLVKQIQSFPKEAVSNNKVITVAHVRNPREQITDHDSRPQRCLNSSA